jgi:hypothetical protein
MTWEWAIPIMGAAGMGMSAVGAVSSGNAQAKMARYNSEMSRKNAETARRNAEILRQEGEAEANKQRQQGEDLLAQQRATYGAAGVEFTGSPLLVMQETAARVERDALAKKYNFEVGATRQEGQAVNMENQANLQEYAGSTAATSGWLSGAASLLKGGWQMFGNSPLTNKTGISSRLRDGF